MDANTHRRVAVLLERHRQPNQWEAWRFGINDVVGDDGAFGDAPRTLRDDGRYTLTLHPGLTVTLHRDEAEGYYLNLSSGAPGVVCDVARRRCRSVACLAGAGHAVLQRGRPPARCPGARRQRAVERRTSGVAARLHRGALPSRSPRSAAARPPSARPENVSEPRRLRRRLRVSLVAPQGAGAPGRGDEPSRCRRRPPGSDAHRTRHRAHDSGRGLSRTQRSPRSKHPPVRRRPAPSSRPRRRWPTLPG